MKVYVCPPARMSEDDYEAIKTTLQLAGKLRYLDYPAPNAGEDLCEYVETFNDFLRLYEYLWPGHGTTRGMALMWADWRWMQGPVEGAELPSTTPVGATWP